MAPLFELSVEAQNDLFEIWRRIAVDSVDLADRVETQSYELFETISRSPRIGHTRLELTRWPVLFFPLYSFLVIYQPEAKRAFAVDGSLRGGAALGAADERK